MVKDILQNPQKFKYNTTSNLHTALQLCTISYRLSFCFNSYIQHKINVSAHPSTVIKPGSDPGHHLGQ